MRERKTWLVVTFHTTAAAIGMEKLCAARGLAGRLIPAVSYTHLTLPTTPYV